MRKQIVAIAVAATASVGVVGLSSTVAASEVQGLSGGRCVAAGVRTLIDLGLLDEAARRQIDYSTLADPETGPIYAELPEGSYLPLSTVIRLHSTNPDLFAWCR